MQILLNNIWNLTKTQIQINKLNKYVSPRQRLFSSPPSSSKEIHKTNETQAKEQKSLHVAVIGVPNVGKSTFINNLINHRVSRTYYFEIFMYSFLILYYCLNFDRFVPHLPKSTLHAKLIELYTLLARLSWCFTIPPAWLPNGK